MLAHDLPAFVVPDARFARAAGLDIEAAGLRPVATPRHATVLLLVGEVPAALASAAAVAYAQMPRPRTILAAGLPAVAGLPGPDVATPLDQEGLVAGVAELRRKLAEGAFAPEAAAFDSAAVRTRTEYVCPMHPEIVRDEPGSCPICGMDLVTLEAAGPTAGTDHAPMAGHDQADPGMGREAAAAARPDGARPVYTCPMHPEVVADQPGKCPICGMRLVTRSPEPVALTAGAAAPLVHAGLTYTCPMHPQIVQSEPDRCPICGMILAPNNDPAASEHAGHPSEPRREPTADGEASEPGGADGGASATPAGHAGHQAAATADPVAGARDAEGHRRVDHGRTNDDAMGHHDPAGQATTAHPDHDVTMLGHAAHAASAETMDHAAMGHRDRDRGAMDHSMHGGFMSMVAITKDLPRSADGLRMERVEAPFGPLFPGLPGGLAVTFTLDGDGVARAAVATGATARWLETSWPGPVPTFPERLARLDPVVPVAYRLLAHQALESVATVVIDERTSRRRVRHAEWERVGSHLGWLAKFGSLIGANWLARGAAALQLAVARAEDDVARVAGEIRGFVHAIGRAPLINRRLAGIGEVGAGKPDRLRGPVARAAGLPTDARTKGLSYQALGFVPVVDAGGDALARLRVRLAEVTASLDLLQAVTEGDGSGTVGASPLPADLSGSAEAAVETPRGEARLRVVVEHGTVVAAELDAPSARHIELVPEVAEGAEVADALVAVASLDLSPWEVDR